MHSYPPRSMRQHSTVLLIAVCASLVSLLAACGSSDATATPSRTIDIVATEFRFSGDPGVAISAGETILFTMTNQGQLEHEMQVLDPDAKLIGKIERRAPGQSGEVAITFDAPGVYTVICDIDDHLTQGQRSQFPVE